MTEMKSLTVPTAAEARRETIIALTKKIEANPICRKIIQSINQLIEDAVKEGKFEVEYSTVQLRCSWDDAHEHYVKYKATVFKYYTAQGYTVDTFRTNLFTITW